MRSPSATSRSARSRSRPPTRVITATAPSQCSAASSQAKPTAACAAACSEQSIALAASPDEPARRWWSASAAIGDSTVHLLDRGGGLRVQPLAARAAQPRVEGLADERVREAIGRAAVAVELHHELGVARLLERRDQRRRPPAATVARRTSNEHSRPSTAAAAST